MLTQLQSDQSRVTHEVLGGKHFIVSAYCFPHRTRVQFQTTGASKDLVTHEIVLPRGQEDVDALRPPHLFCPKLLADVAVHVRVQRRALLVDPLEAVALHVLQSVVTPPDRDMEDVRVNLLHCVDSLNLQENTASEFPF